MSKNNKNSIQNAQKKKTPQTNRKRTKAQAQAPNIYARALARTLDTGAAAWLKLLNDPCNAPLTPGCYPGVTTGMLYRTRTMVNPGPSATDAIIVFSPGIKPSNYDGGYYPLQFVSSNTYGGTPGTRYAETIGSLPKGEIRCVSACMKLWYTGTEMERGGMVGTQISETPSVVGGVPTGIPGYTGPPPYQFLQQCHTTRRLGDAAHEVRWLPSFNDGEFRPYPFGTAGTQGTGDGNTIAIALHGVPAGKVLVELTAVWEVVVEANSHIVPSMRGPTSGNSLNDVLRAVGDVARWATDPTNQSKVIGAFSTAGRIAGQALRMAPNVAMLTM